MDKKEIPVVFSPENEPYLGRKLLFHLDQVIISCLEQNSKIAPQTKKIKYNRHQKAASVLIPQCISLILSARELIRQGYLFGSITLLRPIVERISILLYLHLNPSAILIWEEGWEYKKAPGLYKMIEFITSTSGAKDQFNISEITSSYNSIIHGKPDSSLYSLIPLEDGTLGLTPSKALNVPELCDKICAELIPWLVTVQSMVVAYFPNIN